MDFVTRKEAAKFFKVSERTIDRWIKAKVLKAYKLGVGRNSSVRIKKSEVKKFLLKGRK